MTESELKEQYNLRIDSLNILKNKIVDQLAINLESINFKDAIYGRVKSKKSFIHKVLSVPNKIEVDQFNSDILAKLQGNHEDLNFIDNMYSTTENQKRKIKNNINASEFNKIKAIFDSIQFCKYQNPFQDVEDVIGIRILTLFKSVSESISKKVKDDIFPCDEYEYRQELNSNNLPNEKAFGYEGFQSIHTIPQPYKNDFHFKDLPNVFELQVRTLFQHAWAEPEHEINYKRKMKFSEKQEYDYRRSFYWIAASSWGSDKILEDLYKQYKNEIDKK